MDGTGVLILTVISAGFFTAFLYQAHRLRTLARKYQQEKINTETQKLRVEAMLDSIGDGVVATDKNGVVIFLNKVAEEILAWTPEMLGKRLGDISLLADENGKHVSVDKHPLHLCLTQKKKIITKNYHFVRSGSFDLAVYISATPIILNDSVAGAIEVFRDITQEKAIDKAKSEFVYLASHQLRTPLATIGWYLELLLSQDAGPITADQKIYLDEAYLSTRHMVELVNEMLDASRLELGTLAAKIEPTKLGEILDEVINETKSLIVKKEIIVKKKISKDFPIINADPKHSRIILQNLVTNAVKYTPEKGTVTITIKTEENSYQIIVSDTGYGIPKAEQGKIFSKLFRADNIKDKIPSGTGLGLYTVKSIVDQLHGAITFVSQENKGTTFTITLPLTPARPAKKTPKTSPRA